VLLSLLIVCSRQSVVVVLLIDSEWCSGLRQALVDRVKLAQLGKLYERVWARLIQR
jgi:hypothetical protein